MKTVLSFFLLTFAFQLIFAQQDIKQANYHFKSENYPVAFKLYSKLYKKDTNNAEYAYRLGICQLNTNNNPAQALEYLLKVEKERNGDPVYQMDLGRAYMYNYKFNDAVKHFEECKNKAGKNIDIKEVADLWISMANNAKVMVKNPVDVSFVNMGKYINSAMDELTPYITPDNEILLYTTNRKFDAQVNLYTYDVYYSYMTYGYFKKGKQLSAVNSIDDEYIAGVSLTNERIFIQLQGYEGFQDFISSNKKGKNFMGKTFLNKNVNSKAAEIACYETVSGDTLFFSSDREGGFGGMDIYYSLKLPTGEWSVPLNLGDKVNTIYDEDYPVISADGSKLYFSSNRPQSMGGYDIFVSNITKNREFTTPKNIGYPLNDVFDNHTIAFSNNDRYAYVSAIKPDGYGYTDLYRVVFLQKDPAVKIFKLKFVVQNGDKKNPFAKADTTLKITAYQKGKVIFGEYAYNPKYSSSTIALPPGYYTIVVTGKYIEEYSYKVTVPEIPSGSKFSKKEIILKLKEN